MIKNIEKIDKRGWSRERWLQERRKGIGGSEAAAVVGLNPYASPFSVWAENKFRRAKNTPRGRGAIRAQVVLELENFLAKEIITAYDGVKVTADETDPTRALVDFSFTVAHGLNQIWLSAHITV